ncbi:MAG: ribulokinase [Treponema sp.]|nr:ribulokinase [Treponema sp.]
MAGSRIEEAYVLGLDFGTDSCRALIVSAHDGSEAASSSAPYKRWARGLYSDPGENRFRQHPLDHLEAMEEAVHGAVIQAGREIGAAIRAIGIDTTGSSPTAVDASGTPLALREDLAENPSAMFVLWKDHTSLEEAELINRVNQNSIARGGPDYLRLNGGLYSSEWYWSKVLHILRKDPQVAASAASFVEHCDWISGLLTGTGDLNTMKRNRCSMSLRALWHKDFGGYPPRSFFEEIDPRLLPILDSLGNQCFPADTQAGFLCDEWAQRFGLPSFGPAKIPVSLGALDAHIGGIGGGVAPGRMVLVAGTSACHILVGEAQSAEALAGICGQEEGSVIPGLMGYEAGQSAFGDLLAWYRDLLLWPLKDPALKGIAASLPDRLLPELEGAASMLGPCAGGLLSLDWHNGRRTPDVNPRLKGAFFGLNLGSDAPRLYRSLVEALAFGSRAILERFREGGIAVNEISAVGGVACKSPLVMQILSDTLNMPIHVLASQEAVALGSAMCAAAAAGLYSHIPAAQAAMASPVEKTYLPRTHEVAAYEVLYQSYQVAGKYVEG